MDSLLVSLPLELKIIIGRMVDSLSLRMLMMTCKELEQFTKRTPELQSYFWNALEGKHIHAYTIRNDYLWGGSLKQLKCCRIFKRPSRVMHRFATQRDAVKVLFWHSLEESLEIFQWFHSLGRMAGDNYLLDQVTYRYENNRILNWLLSAGYKPQVSTMTAAACHGNLEAMQMLHEVGCKIDPKPVLDYAWRAKNTKDILQWLDDIHMEYWRSMPSLFELLDFHHVKLAIQVGNLEVLDWLLCKKLLNQYRDDYYQLEPMFEMPRPSHKVCDWLNKNHFSFKFKD